MHSTWRRYGAVNRRRLWARTRTDSLSPQRYPEPHALPAWHRNTLSKHTHGLHQKADFMPIQTAFLSCDQSHSRAFRSSVSSAQVRLPDSGIKQRARNTPRLNPRKFQFPTPVNEVSRLFSPLVPSTPTPGCTCPTPSSHWMTVQKKLIIRIIKKF